MAETAVRQDNHLMCLLLDAAPALPVYAYGVPPYGGMNIPHNWEEAVREAQRVQETRVDSVEQLLAKTGASGTVLAIFTATTDAKHHVARCACVSDEAVMADNLRDTPEFLRETASGVLFHSPIGLRVNAALLQKPECVFVAWDSSKAASAAVHASLPYLKEARDVVIGCIDPVMTTDRDGQAPGTDVAAWLSHHGCRVTVSQFPSGGRPISDCIQDHAKEAGADLVVMGAYGHARMIQAVMGGTTRSMIEQTALPVFFAH
ncbi:MAG: universal stress protein [Paracoccaceae bacterium]|nr:universal stress protein [Paracoccaceae bacterium]